MNNERLYTKRSDSISNLAAALSKAQGEIASAVKEATAGEGTKYQYNYATLDGVWNACRNPLSKNELAIIQMPFSNESSVITIETLLTHSSGEWISTELTLSTTDERQKGVQAVGAIITYARRYMLAAMVGVSQADDDGQASAEANRVTATNNKVPGKEIPPPEDENWEQPTPETKPSKGLFFGKAEKYFKQTTGDIAATLKQDGWTDYKPDNAFHMWQSLRRAYMPDPPKVEQPTLTQYDAATPEESLPPTEDFEEMPF